MLGWLIITVTVFGSGGLAYCYYKLLNYFIRLKFESEDPYENEPEPPRSRRFRAHVRNCADSDEEDCCLFRDEINDVDMKIHRS